MKRAKIYKPAKTSMQSGRGKAKGWVLEYDGRANRKPEALMGWTQSDSTLSQIKLNFDDLDSAVAYAEKNDIQYYVAKSQERDVPPRNYGDNFK